MNLVEILFIGVGLSMDAVAVSMSNGMVCGRLTKAEYLAMPLFFGCFQGLMPLIGYFAGGFFAEIISRYAGIVILLILGIIGGKMIFDGLRHRGDEVDCSRGLTMRLLFVQAIATSIDAFAVGVGFSAMKVDILPAAGLIALVTATMVVAAIFIGRKCGDVLGNKAEILGGLILIIIAFKAIL